MINLTNIKLVEHCKMALQQKWGYVYGTFGTILNEDTLKHKMKQYPQNVSQFETFIRQNWMDRRVTDCIGLIKSYLWWDNGKVRYNSTQDKSANGMYQVAKEKGAINTIPEVPGILVWKSGHIGVYIGNGQVIESRGTKQGVIQSPLKGSGSAGWTNWCKCVYIGYTDAKEEIVNDLTTINITLHGKEIDVEGIYKDKTNYIPVRFLEMLGYSVKGQGTNIVIEYKGADK